MSKTRFCIFTDNVKLWNKTNAETGGENVVHEG